MATEALTGGGITPEQLFARGFDRLMRTTLPSKHPLRQSRKTYHGVKLNFVNFMLKESQRLR